ncbi:MAG: hypothetical protein IT184_13595 [Acidobacteria bacterium]|nr:hypothetical protein [Acidobacteriota bacterium]
MSTSLKQLLFCALLISVIMPARAWSQAAAAHLQILGGVTDAAERAPMFGAALGLRLTFIEVDVEAGHFNNVLSKTLLDALNDLQRERDLPVQAIAELPANYVLGTLRIIPAAGPIRPFLSVGGGVARLKPRLKIVVEGISLGDVFGLTTLGSQDEPIATVGAGLRIDPGKIHLEVGYRLVAVFTNYRGFNISANGATYVNNIYGALGVRF